MYACESDWYDTGRLDVDGVRWYVCDPYPTWFRWVNEGGTKELILRKDDEFRHNPLVVSQQEWEEYHDFPAEWAE